MGAQALYITEYRGKVHQLVLVGPSRLSLEALIPSFFFLVFAVLLNWFYIFY